MSRLIRTGVVVIMVCLCAPLVGASAAAAQSRHVTANAVGTESRTLYGNPGWEWSRFAISGSFVGTDATGSPVIGTFSLVLPCDTHHTSGYSGPCDGGSITISDNLGSYTVGALGSFHESGLLSAQGPVMERDFDIQVTDATGSSGTGRILLSGQADESSPLDATLAYPTSGTMTFDQP